MDVKISTELVNKIGVQMLEYLIFRILGWSYCYTQH